MRCTFVATPSFTLIAIFRQLNYVIEGDTCSYGTKKTPPPILCIKTSAVDDEYCLTQLFH